MLLKFLVQIGKLGAKFHDFLAQTGHQRVHRCLELFQVLQLLAACTVLNLEPHIFMRQQRKELTLHQCRFWFCH